VTCFEFLRPDANVSRLFEFSLLKTSLASVMMMVSFLTNTLLRLFGDYFNSCSAENGLLE